MKLLQSVRRWVGVALLLPPLLSCQGRSLPQIGSSQPVIPGVEVLLNEQMERLAGRRVGLITNPTGVTRGLQATVDVLNEHPQIRLKALFGPEHGVRGNRAAGAPVATYIDEKTGLPVFSLYGAVKKPTAEMLENIDVLRLDIQDVGVRPYTYIYTMAYAMQAAKEQNIPIIVLDRPNPMGGVRVEGPVLEERFSSFIGLYPIAYVHGMTVGELARFFNEEFGIGADLHVVPMRGWRRDMVFSDTGLPWVPTSPHVPQSVTPFFQAAVGALGELTSVNIGIGYTLPFQLVGSEWIDGERLCEALNALNLPGVRFRPLHYVPFYGNKAGVDLQGVQLYILDQRFKPVTTQIALIHTLARLFSPDTLFAGNLRMFRLAMGTDCIDQAIRRGDDLAAVIALADIGLEAFLQKRQKYLLY